MASLTDTDIEKGYPAFSKWMASSSDFMVLRRFDHLNVRALLLLQEELVREERTMLAIDGRARNANDFNMGRCDIISKDRNRERIVALRQLVPALEQYSLFPRVISLNTWHKIADGFFKIRQLSCRHTRKSEASQPQ
jgi:hypothetical protein